MSNLSDKEINVKLAKAIGLKRFRPAPAMWVHSGPDGPTIATFSPCTNHDDLAVVVRHMSNEQLAT